MREMNARNTGPMPIREYFPLGMNQLKKLCKLIGRWAIDRQVKAVPSVAFTQSE